MSNESESGRSVQNREAGDAGVVGKSADKTHVGNIADRIIINK